MFRTGEGNAPFFLSALDGPFAVFGAAAAKGAAAGTGAFRVCVLVHALIGDYELLAGEVFGAHASGLKNFSKLS